MRLDLRDALRSLPTARRLAPRFDAALLQAALAALDEGWWHPHAGPYNERGWESVSLWAPRGDPLEQTSRGGDFSATPVLLRSPAFASVLDHFSAERNRVRLMRLQPGGKILRHSDPIHTIDSRLVRLHVPVTTNPDVWFEVNDRRITMHPGRRGTSTCASRTRSRTAARRRVCTSSSTWCETKPSTPSSPPATWWTPAGSRDTSWGTVCRRKFGGRSASAIEVVT